MILAFFIVTTVVFFLCWLFKNINKTYQLGYIVDKYTEVSAAELSRNYYLVVSYKKDGSNHSDKIQVSSEAFNSFNIKDKVII